MRFLLALALVAAPLLAQGEADADARATGIARKLSSAHPEERIAGLNEAATSQHSKLVSPIAKLLKDRNVAIRTLAIETLQLRTKAADKKRAARALAARLDPLSRKETDRRELLDVIAALHDLAQPATLKTLLDIKSGTDREVMSARAMAAANVPSKEAIERLIQYGYRDRRGSDSTRRIATQALAYATQAKVSGGIEGWRRWWSENKRTFDPTAAAEARESKRQATAEKERQRRERRERRERKRRKQKEDGES